MNGLDPQIAIAAISAIAAIVLAFFKLIVEVRSVHTLVNSRMTELLDLTRSSALAQGRLSGEQVGQLHLNVPGPVDKSEHPA